jgi:uncharacterized protein with NAD-binding domain and iron-sulfur cluster
MKITIVGGGTAAWMTASYLSKQHPTYQITVIDKEFGNPIGVGEATAGELVRENRGHIESRGGSAGDGSVELPVGAQWICDRGADGQQAERGFARGGG